ncbi:MAG TPA: LysM peptidoglycan-binding domain-containing protein, partial [Thermoanaerobaculia bacterium]|nr:LysM peptidoglycan-binding domain-containing protein [Thermoanaerobaculia bacterium]
MKPVRRHRALVLLCLAGCLLAGSPASAAKPESGWHIVRPGETLHRVAARYLGSAARWPEIARLNPGIEDPNRLEPGQRIRVSQATEAPAARVARLSRKVEAQPTPIAWENARQDDLLLEKDGLRTYGKSSAEMAFSDGTRLLVTESSLVFLQRTGGQLRGVDRKAVEIVEGQADVESGIRPAGGAAPEVEIVLGSTRARSRPTPSRATPGAARTRARRSEEGGAKLMVYGGEGEVEAGGAKVSVPAG